MRALVKQALKDFRSSVHAWSAAELSRVRPAVKTKRQRSWRLAAGWALAGVLVVGGVSGGFYEHHQQELKIAAAARLAEQQQVARELQAREDEEELQRCFTGGSERHGASGSTDGRRRNPVRATHDNRIAPMSADTRRK